MLLQQMSVDTSRTHYIRLNFNLTYPALPCQGVRSLHTFSYLPANGPIMFGPLMIYTHYKAASVLFPLRQETILRLDHLAM